MRESFLFQVLNLGALTPVVLESAYQEPGRRWEKRGWEGFVGTTDPTMFCWAPAFLLSGIRFQHLFVAP